MRLSNILGISSLIFVAMLSGCGKGSKESSEIRPIGIAITGDTTNTIVGNSFAVSVTLQYSDTSGERITNEVSWLSSDKTVATISADSIVSCLTDGKSVLTATFENFKDNFNVTCSKRPFVDEINATIDSKILQEGQSLGVFVTARLNNSETVENGIIYTWKSSNEEIATIDNKGLITAIKFGETDITIGLNKDDQSAPYNFTSISDIKLTIQVLPSAISIKLAPSKDEAALPETSLNYELEFGDQAYLKAFQLLGNGELNEITSSVVRNFSWNYDRDILSIDENGLLILKSEGTTNVDLKNFSGLSAEKIATITVEKPLEIFVTDDSNSQISLIWNPKFDSIKYQLRWKTSDALNFSPLEVLTDTNFNLGDIQADKDYLFEVAYEKSDSSFSDYASIEVKPHSDILQKLNEFPTQINAASITLNGKFYLFGGEFVNSDGSSFSSDEVWEYDLQTDIWIKLPTKLNEPRQEAAVCELNGTIYLIGGYNSTPSLVKKYLKSIVAYQPASGTWFTVSDTGFTFPALKNASCSSDINNSKLYLVGGMIVINESENTFAISDTVYQFSVDSTSAEIVTQSDFVTFSTARHRHQSIIINNSLYIMGGLTVINDITSAISTVEIIDLNNQPLSSAISIDRMPLSRFDFNSFLINNNVYVIGGHDFDNNLVTEADYFDLDPNSITFNSWVTDIDIPFDDASIIATYDLPNQNIYLFHHFNEADIPANKPTAPTFLSDGSNSINWRFIHESAKNIFNTAAGVIGDNIFLFGGRTPSNLISNKVQVFNATTDTWVTDIRGPADLNIPRENAAAVSVNNSIFLISGKNDNNQYLSTVEIYNQVSNANLWTISNKTLTSPRSNACAVYFDKYIYIFGGENSNGLVQNVERFGPITPSIGNARWSNFSVFEEPRAGMSCVTIGDSIYLIGGYTETVSKSATNEVTTFLPNANRLWLNIQNMNTPRIKPAVSVLNKNIYVFAGRSDVLSNNLGHTSSEVYTFSNLGRGWATASFRDLNFQSNNPSSALVGNKIYLFANDTQTKLGRNTNTSSVYILE